MKYLFLTLILLNAVLLAGAIPGIALAQGAPSIVPNCIDIPPFLTQYCTVCHIFQLIQNVLNFLWYFFTIPVATIMLMYAGFLMVSTAFSGNPNAHQKGRTILTNTIIGIALIFLSWLLVDTIIKVLSNQDLKKGEVALIPAITGGFGPWNKIECEATGPQPGGPGPGQKPGGGGGPPPVAKKAWYCKTGGVCSCAEQNPHNPANTDFTSCVEVTAPECPVAGPMQCPQDAALTELKKILGGKITVQGPSKDSCSDTSGAIVSAQTTAAERGAGQALTVCQHGCTPASKSCAKNPAVTINNNLVRGLVALGEVHAGEITSLTTGSHAVGSQHYTGDAIDIKPKGANPTLAQWENFLAFFKDPENLRRFNIRKDQIFCESRKSRKASCLEIPAGEKITHIHIGFNR